jgi:hypothetical protein
VHFLVIVLIAIATIVGSGSLLEQAGALISRTPQPTHPVVACAVGLVIGLLLACSARCGSAPKMRSAFFLRPAVALLTFAVLIAALGGLTAYFLVTRASPELQAWQPLSSEVASRRDPVFFALLCAKLSGAAAMILGSIVLAHFTLKLRRRAQAELSPSRR